VGGIPLKKLFVNGTQSTLTEAKTEGEWKAYCQAKEPAWQASAKRLQ